MPCNKKIAAVHKKEFRSFSEESHTPDAGEFAARGLLELPFVVTFLVAIEQTH
jgi:hypothetical protein